MKTVKTVKGQTLQDLAVQEYGNQDAAFIILEDNPQIAGLNEFETGDVVDEDEDFDFSSPIKANISINIRETGDFIDNSVLRNIKNIKVISL